MMLAVPLELTFSVADAVPALSDATAFFAKTFLPNLILKFTT